MARKMRTERCIVDNRVFLLGLDKLYRDAMKAHERGELLSCARRVAAALRVAPTNAPVEGCYAENQQLTEYFQLVRALQQVHESRTAEVVALPEFNRLRDVICAPLYGRPQQHDRLLPVGRDALSQALVDTRPEWTVARLTAAAYNRAGEMDDISLVGLAARVQDPLVLTAVRESVVLYAELVVITARQPRREYVWNVDDDLAEQATRFIAAFNVLLGKKLPPPEPQHAQRYWLAYHDNEIVGRCVRLGDDVSGRPPRYYHWAICRGPQGLIVQEFWSSELWTTARFRKTL